MFRETLEEEEEEEVKNRLKVESTSLFTHMVRAMVNLPRHNTVYGEKVQTARVSYALFAKNEQKETIFGSIVDLENFRTLMCVSRMTLNMRVCFWGHSLHINCYFQANFVK